MDDQSTEQPRPFVGRIRELNLLRDLHHLRIAKLVVIKGRRRIGKSRLAEEFSKGVRTLSFFGLTPDDETTAQSQRNHFAEQMERLLGEKPRRSDNWDPLLWDLAGYTKAGRVVIIFDEINWMGSKDPAFLPKLKTTWDAYFSKNPELVLILSGSLSGWIEANILRSTGFFGRVTMEMTLDELPLADCVKFWGPLGDNISTFEKFKLLSVTGGVPRYLELIQPKLSAESNIHRLCFQRDGTLYTEFDRIFSDLFSRRSDCYKSIVELTAGSSQTQKSILSALHKEAASKPSEYLDDLVKTGYLARDFTWSIKGAKRSKLSRYRLCDNYLRFYLRYVEPMKELIASRRRVKLPPWHTIMGLQFENLVLNNLNALLPLLGIDDSDIVYLSPYFQTPTKRRRGCQIDLMIQTQHGVLYVCEIKFSKEPIGTSVIQEVQEKIKRLELPRGFSVRPVLIHVNGTSYMIQEGEFFSHIIDFSQLLQPNDWN